MLVKLLYIVVSYSIVGLKLLHNCVFIIENMEKLSMYKIDNHMLQIKLILKKKYYEFLLQRPLQPYRWVSSTLDIWINYFNVVCKNLFYLHYLTLNKAVTDADEAMTLG